MKLAILGAGSVGSALGKSWAKQGHSIIFGVRDANAPKIQTLLAEIGTTAQAASLAEAADRSDVVVLTVTWEAMPEVVKAVGNLEGKILLDCTNPLVGNQLDAAMNLTQSGGEQVADWFPTAKVVKILNQVGWETMANPLYGAETATMFYAGNDRDAKQMAAQLAIDRGIRANAISPGPIATPMLGKSGLPAEQVQQIAEAYRNQIPLKRFGEPIEIAKAAVFLASDESSFMLGSEMIIDGGRSTL